jgi:hypothetical protein
MSDLHPLIDDLWPHILFKKYDSFYTCNGFLSGAKAKVVIYYIRNFN